MLAIPEIDRASVIFGDIKHMPKYDTIPEEFKRYNSSPYAKAVSHWFFSGAERDGEAIVVDGVKFVPREGVNATKALAAIAAVLKSFEPKHEHKEAACAYMLHEWFALSRDKREESKA